MKFIARMMLVVILASIFALPAMADSIRVYAADEIVRYYESASSSSKQLGKLGYGQQAKCTELDGDWAKIESGSATGWCKTSDLTTKDPNTGSLTSYVVSGGANAYELPSTTASKAFISGGTKLTAVAITPDKEWCRVHKDGVYAYMRVSDLSTENTAAEASSSQSGKLTAYIADETVTLRKSASGSSAKLAVAAFGEKVTCIAVDGKRVQVEYGNITGWCSKSELTTEDPNTYSLAVYAKEAGTEVYDRPSGQAICTIGTTSELKCLCETPDGKWLRVTASGKYGYVKKSEMTTEKSDSKVDKLIDLAMQQLGKPYVYATRGPKSFDCSGLTLYCFREVAGIQLGRSAQSQGYNEKYEKIESYSELKKGDIVCFNTVDDDDLTDHVGIYLGGGKFIHASTVTNDVVISNMSSGYYSRTFVWARRLID